MTKINSSRYIYSKANIVGCCLPPAVSPMVTGREYVEHGLVGEGGEVPDGLHPWEILLSLLECDRPGPTT